MSERPNAQLHITDSPEGGRVFAIAFADAAAEERFLEAMHRMVGVYGDQSPIGRDVFSLILQYREQTPRWWEDTPG